MAEAQRAAEAAKANPIKVLHQSGHQAEDGTPCRRPLVAGLSLSDALGLLQSSCSAEVTSCWPTERPRSRELFYLAPPLVVSAPTTSYRCWPTHFRRCTSSVQTLRRIPMSLCSEPSGARNVAQHPVPHILTYS